MLNYEITPGVSSDARDCIKKGKEKNEENDGLEEVEDEVEKMGGTPKLTMRRVLEIIPQQEDLKSDLEIANNLLINEFIPNAGDINRSLMEHAQELLSKAKDSGSDVYKVAWAIVHAKGDNDVEIYARNIVSKLKEAVKKEKNKKYH